MFKLSLIGFFFCFWSINLFAQKKFTISGTLPIRYDGVEINLSSDDSLFLPLKTMSVKSPSVRFFSPIAFIYFFGEAKSKGMGV